MRSFAFKVSLIVVMLSTALCISLPIVKAGDVVPLNWTSPTTNGLLSVFMVGASDGWAVGLFGTIIRWNGTDWTTVTSPTTNGLLSVFMISATEGWAVGGSFPGETIIHWDGTSWSNVTSPTTYILWSVFMISATDGWAVGDRGTIIHWDGTDWSMVASPTINQLNSVFMVGASDGWAVGADGTIIRWNGTEWVVPEFPIATLMPLLLTVALVAAILTKTVLKKHNPPFLLVFINNTQIEGV